MSKLLSASIGEMMSSARGAPELKARPLAKGKLLAEGLTLAGLGKLIKGRKRVAICTAAIYGKDAVLRERAITALKDSRDIAALKTVLKKTDDIADGLMVANTLIEMCETGEAISVLEASGDRGILLTLAKTHGGAEGDAAVWGLKRLGARKELAELVEDIRNELNGPEDSSGEIKIAGSQAQLRTAITAVSALEELGAKKELAAFAKGKYSTPEARQLRAGISHTVRGM
jgi:hypothetical protein